ncbi:hypothetical protein J6590_060550 [Homalodisca vitripennis]|nr:hypothetical protein J6590_060550 [Homalodisca vitripennis]
MALLARVVIIYLLIFGYDHADKERGYRDVVAHTRTQNGKIQQNEAQLKSEQIGYIHDPRTARNTKNSPFRLSSGVSDLTVKTDLAVWDMCFEQDFPHIYREISPVNVDKYTARVPSGITFMYGASINPIEKALILICW